MKRKLIICILFLSANLFACKRQRSPALSIVDIIETGTDSIAWRRYNKEKQIVETITSYYGVKMKTIVLYDSVKKNQPRRVHSYFVGKNYGHDFHFDQSGNIALYSYYTGHDFYSSYIRYYDSLKLIKEEGGILVDRIRDHYRGGVTLFIVNAFHDNIKAEVSSPNYKPSSVDLRPSSLQPLLLEAYLSWNTDSLFYISVAAQEKESRQSKIYHDTVWVGSLQ